MAACARGEIVRDDEVGVYHVWTRCVRRTFLCGVDPLTGQDYNHRRQWIRDFEERLAGLFGVEIGFHAEMSNHLHLVLRSRPDVVQSWSDDEVARRWLTVNRLVKSRDGDSIRQLTESDLAVETFDAERISKLRTRLSSVSFFMKALCEHIGRRGNREDGCTGRFFEGRFKCRLLANEASILVCGMYVDLNQIRAGEALTPDESSHTSAYDRIQAWKERSSGEGGSTDSSGTSADGWLCELTLQQGLDVDITGLNHSATGRRASEKGLLPVRLEEYLRLLDWTGRAVREEQSGAIPAEFAPILARLGIQSSLWTDLVSQFDHWFSHIVGSASHLVTRAGQAGRHWYQGRVRCAESFG